jgi:hypothetical protein
MKTKYLAIALIAALWPALGLAQTYSNPVGANLTVADAGTCSTNGSFLWQHLPNNTGTTTVNLAGTFTATLTVRESNNGGGTWTTANTLSAAGTTTYSTGGFTDLCVDVTAFTSGPVQASISTGLQQVQSVVSGGNSSVSSPAPNMGWYLGSNCSTANTGQCFFSPVDTQQVNDCAWTAATPSTVTCASSHFVAADVGKQVAGWNNCQAFAQGAGGAGALMGANAITVSGAPLITSFISGTSVQITTAANAQATQVGCFVWGHPDDTYAAAIETAYATATSCVKLFLQGGYYMFTKPHFSSTPAACAALGISAGNVNPGFGNVFYSGGFEIEGRGVGPTTVFLMPNFPNGDPCNRGPNSIACFVVPTEGRWHDWSMTGGSNPIGLNTSNWTLVYANVATIDNWTCTNYGAFENAGTGSGAGLDADYQVQLVQWNNSGCGNVGLRTISTHGNITCFRCSIENSAITDVQVNGATTNLASISFYNSQLLGSQSQLANTNGIIQNIGGTVVMYNTTVLEPLAPSGAVIRGYSTSTSGSTLIAHDSVIDVSSGNTGNGGLLCLAACKNVLENTTIKGGSLIGTATSYLDVAGSTFVDLGGNSFNIPATIQGTLIADGHSLLGSCTGVATASSTLGLYGTGPNETLTTCTSTTIGSGVVISQARTLGPLRVTVTAAGVNASSGVVTVLKNGGATTITCTLGTATSCLDNAHSVAVAAGDLISIQFTTQAADTLAGVKAFLLWE